MLFSLPWKQILRFMLAGGLGVLLYYVLLYVLTEHAGFWYLASATIAALANQTCNFFTLKFWAFQNHAMTHVHRQVNAFAVLKGTLFGANLALLWLLVELVNLWYMAAQLIVTAILTTASYLISERIFRD
ncbi:MAG: GtrA family protein [Candidatus Doudnabacteria bacterium]|nr:GtrA family protein [Candidatus Doudnabacteria bacterium]